MNEEELKDMALKFQSALLESSYRLNQKLEKQDTQLKDNWNKLKEWLEKESTEYKKDSYSSEYGLIIGTMLRTLDKMQEIEGR